MVQSAGAWTLQILASTEDQSQRKIICYTRLSTAVDAVTTFADTRSVRPALAIRSNEIASVLRKTRRLGT